MERRALGQTDLFIPPIVFGAMARREQSDRQRVEVLRAAIDRGFTAIDTAPLYGYGQSELQIAQALKGRPKHQAQIFTKVGLRWDAGHHGDVLFEDKGGSGGSRVVRKDSRPESVRWEVEQSLTRLRLECLDLVQVHHPDIHTPIAETLGALLDLRRQGKLRHIGVSNFSPAQIRDAQTALGDTPLCCVQSEYSLLRRGIETALLPMCTSQQIGVLAYSPLATGMLTDPGNRALGADVVATINQSLQPIAQHHTVSCAAVALAWVYHQSAVTAAVSGASSPSQLDDQSTALQLQLSDDETDRLSTAFAKVALVHSWEKTGLLDRLRRFAGWRLRALFRSS